MYRVNYCETVPDDETRVVNTQGREFTGPIAQTEALEYVQDLMRGPMEEAAGTPGIIVTYHDDQPQEDGQ